MRLSMMGFPLRFAACRSTRSGAQIRFPEGKFQSAATAAVLAISAL
jgi:hypothetical protein